MAALMCVIFAVRRERAPAAGLRADTVAAPTGNAGTAARRGAVGRDARLSFRPEFLTQTSQPVDGEPSTWPAQPAARDDYYERLLLKQGRDQAKEQQLLSRLNAVFGDDPDTLIGAITCSPEFCRVELRGVGQVDVREEWQDDLYSAVEPKGLRIFVVDADSEGNTMASCYFGRDESWTIPDFPALGLL